MRPMRTDIDSLGFGMRVDPGSSGSCSTRLALLLPKLTPQSTEFSDSREVRAWCGGGGEPLRSSSYRSHRTHKRHIDPVGPQNDEAIMAAVGFADRVVAAWGTRGVLNRRDEVVAGLTRRASATVEVLGLTMAGHPRHPLYITKTTQPYPWMV